MHGKLLEDLEQHAVAAGGSDPGEADALVIGDLELPARFHAKHADQVMRLVTGKLGLATADLVHEEAAAGHVQ